jgi:hypothetical protein
MEENGVVLQSIFYYNWKMTRILIEAGANIPSLLSSLPRLLTLQ